MVRGLIITLLVCFTDSLKIFCVLHYIVGYNIFFEMKSIIKYAIGIASLFTVTYMTGVTYIYQPLFFIPIILFLLVKSIERFDFKVCIFFLITYICICQIDVFITSILELGFPQITFEWAYDLLCAILSVILFVGICLICKKFNIVINKEEKPILFLLIQLGMLILIVFLCGTASVLVKKSSDIFLNKLLLFSVSGIAVLITIGGLIMYTLTISNQHHKEMEVLNKRLLDIQSQHYRDIKKKNEDIRRFRHDIKNHIICLKFLLNEKEYDKATNYVLQLDKHIHEFKVRYNCGNHVIDAILNEKIGYIEENGIRLTLNGKLTEQINIEEYDLCILFANAFTNALEGCMELHENRFVDVSMGIYNGFLSIVVINSISSQKDLKTTKTDKYNHGFGIKNIARIVDKYNGNMQITQTNNSFKIDIIIKVK